MLLLVGTPKFGAEGSQNAEKYGNTAYNTSFNRFQRSFHNIYDYGLFFLIFVQYGMTVFLMNFQVMFFYLKRHTVQFGNTA